MGWLGQTADRCPPITDGVGIGSEGAGGGTFATLLSGATKASEA
jgi:hypothetical protein